MGGSSSKGRATLKYQSLIVNQTDIDILNRSVNDFVANTIINQASHCSASTYQLQEIDLSGMDIGGDLVIDTIDQEQSSNISFDCVQVSAIQNDIASGVVNEYLNTIKESFSSEAMTQLLNNAKTSSEQQFGGIGEAKASTKVNTEYEYTNITQVDEHLQNIVENSISNNFNVEDLQECIATVKAHQRVVLANTTVGGNVSIGAITQRQATDLIANCLQQRNIANDITAQLITQLGIDTDTTNQTSQTTTMESKTDTEAKNKGVFEGIGTALNDLLSGLGEAWIVIAVIVIGAVVVAYFFYGSESSKKQTGGSTYVPTHAYNKQMSSYSYM